MQVVKSVTPLGRGRVRPRAGSNLRSIIVTLLSRIAIVCGRVPLESWSLGPSIEAQRILEPTAESNRPCSRKHLLVLDTIEINDSLGNVDVDSVVPKLRDLCTHSEKDQYPRATEL